MESDRTSSLCCLCDFVGIIQPSSGKSPVNLLAKYNQIGYYQFVEKKTAHYPLTDIKALVRAGRVYATRAALEGAAALGFTFDDMKHVVENLEVSDLHKSMTSQHDAAIWQDVYRYPAEEVDIYLKLQIVGDVVIVSFKEL